MGYIWFYVELELYDCATCVSADHRFTLSETDNMTVITALQGLFLKFSF